jgi:hypothetical protein
MKGERNMQKPVVEIVEKDFNTVGGLIEILKDLPAGFGLSPLGTICQVAVDYHHEAVLMDEPEFLEQYAEEQILEPGETVEIEDEKLTPYKQPLVVVMGYSDLCLNGNEEAQLMGVYSTEDLANEAGTELVELGIISRYELEFPELDEFGWK